MSSTFHMEVQCRKKLASKGIPDSIALLVYFKVRY